VIHKRITQKEAFGKNSTAHTKQRIQTRVKNKIDEFISYILALSREKKIMIANPDVKLGDYLNTSLKLLRPHIGDISITDYCYACRRKIPPRYKFSGLGHYDVQHAMNAKEFSVDEFITFDKGFKLLSNIPDFNSVSVKVL